MGRHRNISQPMVLDVMLAPFTESFVIEASDTTQQWYYAGNEGTEKSPYVPDRETSPLILTPKLEVFDPDSNETYRPQFGDVKWYYLAANGSFALITNTSEGSTYPYVVYSDGHLKVNKNVVYDAPVTLKCDCPYLDPRSSGVSYMVSGTVVLTTNRDATILSPTVDIECETTQLYDLFKDASSTFVFKAVVRKGLDDITESSSVLWYVLDKTTGVETPINTSSTVGGVAIPRYPCYVSGYNTATLTLNAMYTEDVTVVARVVKDATSNPVELYPCKAIRTLMWANIPMDSISHSNNSGGVRSDTESMSFSPIVNINDAVLSDAQKQAHMMFNWKRRSASSSMVTDSGWGQSLVLKGNTLRANATTLVYAECYVLGAYEVVTDGGEAVIDSGQPVFDRIL